VQGTGLKELEKKAQLVWVFQLELLLETICSNYDFRKEPETLSKWLYRFDRCREPKSSYYFMSEELRGRLCSHQTLHERAKNIPCLYYILVSVYKFLLISQKVQNIYILCEKEILINVSCTRATNFFERRKLKLIPTVLYSCNIIGFCNKRAKHRFKITWLLFRESTKMSQ
jgi:hypothetical protein